MLVLNARRLMTAGLVSLVVWSAGAYAGAVEQLNAFVSSVGTARGEFVQRQVKSDTNDSPPRVAETSNDDFIFSHSDRFVWRYVKPYEQQLSANGQMLYIFDKDLSRVTEHKLDASLGSSPAAILFGNNGLIRNFTLKEGGVKGGIDWVEPTSEAKDTQFQRITISSHNGKLQGMKLRDALGNTTLLTFLNVQKNPQLPANVFHFTSPRRADAIKQ